MGLRRWLTIFLLSLSIVAQANQSYSKHQVLYLMQAGHVSKGIQLYQKLKEDNLKHDFPILEQMGYILLNQGAKSGDEECQLLSMYGAGMAGTLESMDIYQMGMESPNPMTQMATIHFLTEIQDDRAEELLLKAFSSPYLLIRLEAAYALAIRKSLSATGLIDSLMQRLPPPMYVYFPDLFAMIGTADAMGVLQRLMGNRILNVRLASFLAAAKFRRDDFIGDIRTSLTHSDEAELETCAAAVGFLQDSHSIPALKKLSESKSPNVKLAACRSLILLGEQKYQDKIMESAASKNPLAINLLTNLPNTESLLAKLACDYNFHTRVNAALALLKKRDTRAVPTLMRLLIHDEKDLGLEPMTSLGHSLTAWKVIPSCTQYAKKTERDIPSITLAVREQILQDALELPEESFLAIAEKVFDEKQNDLIPLLIHLLENLKTEKAIQLLQRESRRAGAPFIRTYCHLALYRLRIEGPHRETLFKWIEEKKDHEMIHFRPMLPWTEKNVTSQFQLTPEETSRLLIEAYVTLADQHDPEGIDILLSAILEGNEKNRYALAGLLLKSIQ
ncbi:HEAT repeat domain-containing protein [Simkania sp.]|uniref:HEAT repeat domain-containing protein n=1 Tax=Simkania sp. TaxID=34094 RepID=UPI003B51DFA0